MFGSGGSAQSRGKLRYSAPAVPHDTYPVPVLEVMIRLQSA